jgi:hypothetical protein
MNHRHLKLLSSIVGLIGLQACSNVTPTPSKNSITVGAKVDGQNFALSLPYIPDITTIGSEAKLKIANGHVKFAMPDVHCPGYSKSETSRTDQAVFGLDENIKAKNNQDPIPTTKSITRESDVVAEISSPFEPGQQLGPVMLKPGNYSLKLEIFERGGLAYFGAAQFSVAAGIITNLDLALEKPKTCPTPDGGVIVNPNIQNGGVNINPIIPSDKKSACDFLANITRECNVYSATCEWKDPEGNRKIVTGKATCSEAAARQNLIQQLCDQQIMVKPSFVDEIYCMAIPQEPPPPVDETHTILPFDGTVTASLNDSVVMTQDLSGFKESVSITISGLLGDKVRWSNSVNPKTIETILDAKPDSGDKHTIIDFGIANAQTGDQPNNDIEDLARECGQINETTVNHEQAFRGLNKIVGTKLGINFEVIIKVSQSISSTPQESGQDREELIILSSSGGGIDSNSSLSGPISTPARELSYRQKSVSIPVKDSEWKNMAGVTPHKDLYCAVKGVKKSSVQTGENKLDITFSPAMITNPNPLASIDRLRKEIGSSRSFNVTANISEEVTGRATSSVEGTVTINEIRPEFDCQGVVKRADLAYEVINNFPGGAHRLGVFKRQAFYIDTTKKKFVALIQESDRGDVGFNQPQPPICLLSVDESPAETTTDSVESNDSQIKNELGDIETEPKSELVEVEMQVSVRSNSRWRNCLFAEVTGQPLVELGCNRASPWGSRLPASTTAKLNLLTNRCNHINLYLKTDSGRGQLLNVSSKMNGRISSGTSSKNNVAPGPGIHVIPGRGNSFVIEVNDNSDQNWSDLQLQIIPPSDRTDVSFTFENSGVPCR